MRTGTRGREGSDSVVVVCVATAAAVHAVAVAAFVERCLQMVKNNLF